MESPAQRIVVFRLASGAHLEPRHRSLRPVVRNPPCNRESRTAVGAIQKRIAVAPVLRVQQLPQTVPASCRIRRNPGAHRPQNLAGNNPEPHLAYRRHIPGHNRIDPRQRRRLRAQPVEKGLHSLLRPLNLNGHAVRIVADKPRQPLLKRKPVNKRPEPYPLHHSAHQHRPPHFVPFSIWLGFFSQNRASHRRPACRIASLLPRLASSQFPSPKPTPVPWIIHDLSALRPAGRVS